MKHEIGFKLTMKVFNIFLLLIQKIFSYKNVEAGNVRSRQVQGHIQGLIKLLTIQFEHQ